MKILLILVVCCLILTPTASAQSLIFSDGFELGRTCWVWSATAGGHDLCFDMPFNTVPPVGEQTFQFTTEIVKSDVILGMDTTGSMGGEIANLQSSIMTLLEEIRAQIPDCAIAVAGYEDYPYGSYGSWAQGDRAFYLLHRSMTIKTEAGLTSIAAAVDLYQIRGGGDLPESGWEMVFQVATGAGSGTGDYAVPPFDSATAPPVTPPAGEEIGEWGGVGLRAGSMPILVWITDVASHNGVGGNNYGAIPGVVPATYIQALNVMNQMRGRIIGVMSGEGARADLEWAATGTNSVVSPDAWGLDRPSGCESYQCCTGIDGTGVSASGAGLCPLVFEIESDGSGLSTSIFDGIKRLINSEVVNVSAAIVDDPGDSVDVVDAFVEFVEADEGAPPPCAQGLVAIDTDADGVDDTFENVPPETSPCFTLVLKSNTTIPNIGAPQVFGATIETWGDWVTVLGSRNVFFRVPP